MMVAVMVLSGNDSGKDDDKKGFGHWWVDNDDSGECAKKVVICKRRENG